MTTLKLKPNAYVDSKGIVRSMKDYRRDILKELLEWANKEVGYKCARNDFLYRHILQELRK